MNHAAPAKPDPVHDTIDTTPTGHMNTMSTPRLPKPGQSLAEKFPAIAAQWHPTRNGDLTPDQAYAGSNKKAWWRCEQGHEWETAVSKRTSEGTGCPFCSGRALLAGYNDLATRFPKVAAQWHPTKNGDLTPDQVLASSNKKAWWRCDLGHQWEAPVYNRTSRGNGCPVCSGRTVLAGYNDLATRFPAVAAQWHPTRNGDLRPDQVTAGSDAKAWWRCEEGHEWQAPVSRASKGKGCLVCSGKKGLVTRFPDVAAQWHPTRNGDLTPDQVSAGSNKKAWWRCEQGHEWETAVSKRTTYNSTGCPICAGKKVLTGYNDLATVSPDIAKQWHPTRNGYLTPDQVLAGTNAGAWWCCELGHEWETTVSGRTSRRGSGCLVCAGKKVLTGYNDLATTFPTIAAQWHPTRNGELRPDQVSMGSEKRVWWRCDLGHVWQTTVNARTSRGSGCFTCNTGYTLVQVIALIRSMGPHGQGMGSAERFQIAAQAGVLSGVHGKTARELIASGTLPPEYRTDTDKDTTTEAWTNPDEVTTTRTETEQPDTDGADGEIRALTPGADIHTDSHEDVPTGSLDGTGTVEAVAEQPDVDAEGTDEGEEIRVLTPGTDIGTGTDTDEDLERAKIAVLAVPEALAVPEQLFVNASTDTETLKFLIAARVAKIWKAAYAEDRGEVIPAGGQSVAEMTAELRDGEYAEMVRGTFRAEYDAAQTLTPPPGWSFRPGSTPDAPEPVAPNLMQRHVATLLRDRSRVGNWSGAGAGKTVSAVLGARLIDAGTAHAGGKPGVVVVLCPNNTVPGWESVITSCYPDNQVITKTLRPVMADWSGAGPRWLVVNFDRLQQDTSQPDLSALLASYQVDLLVVDEVHLIKHRTDKIEESRRRLAIKGLSCEAGRLNPALSVLVMSATPVVNNLHEARSLLEVLWGVDLDDVKIRHTDINAFNIHALLVRAGVRWMPKYTPKRHEHVPQINVDHLLEPLRELGQSPNAAVVEQTLIDAKLPTIVDACVAAQQQGRRTLVYTHFVHELVEPIRRALEAVGLRVGVFTGADKSGLAAFLGKDTTEGTVRTMAEAERVDVLIGSSAIGTGVDGLQDVADTLIFASLPWTNAEWLQIVGRLHRQGQPHDVDVITPTTWLEHNDHNAEGRTEVWSWDKYRMDVVRYKQSLADTAVDGNAPRGQIIDPDRQAGYVIGWLRRVETNGVTPIVRTPLDATRKTHGRNGHG